MGLDMYLLLDKGRKGTEEIERILNSVEFWEKKRKNMDEFDGLILAKWRKAFGILHWFDCNLESVVNQVLPDDGDREGVQHSVYYKVKRDEVEKLLDSCRRILEQAKYDEPNVPEDLMPVGADFFIGGYENLNEWWWADIDSTVKMLEEAGQHINWNEDDAYFIISY